MSKVIHSSEEAQEALAEYLRKRGKADEVDSIVPGVLGYHVKSSWESSTGFKITDDFYWTFRTHSGEYTVEETGEVVVDFGEEEYTSVEEYFQAEYPDLVGSLNNTGGFWPRVRDNTIPKEELDRGTNPDPNSRVYQAYMAMRNGRRSGKIPEPD